MLLRFENPDYDFPTVIVYAINGVNLSATIWGPPDDGTTLEIPSTFDRCKDGGKIGVR